MGGMTDASIDHDGQPEGRPVTITYTVTHNVTVYVTDEDFTANMGPIVRERAFGPRIGSLMTGYIDRHREDFPQIPSDADIVYVDVKGNDNP